MYRVNKNDGSVEIFNHTKVVDGITKAGGSPDQASKIAEEVEAWLPSVAVNELVEVAQIKAQIIKLLSAVNPQAAASFESFRK